MLLCTLLIGNVAVNSALSIFLGSIVTSVFGILIATSAMALSQRIYIAGEFKRQEGVDLKKDEMAVQRVKEGSVKNNMHTLQFLVHK